MGKKQRDCCVCGAPVGFIGREHCHRCSRRLREQDAKAPCARCGKDRVLNADTGRCVLCSRSCTRCGSPVRAREATLCRRCRRRDAAQAGKAPCPRCGKPGHLRAATGWCGSCSRPGPPKDPPRICQVCGQLRSHQGLGMCSRCFQRDPDRPFVRGEHLIAELEQPPPWLAEFVVFLAARYAPAVALTLISNLGRFLKDEHPNHPQALLGRAVRPGRSIGSLARALEQFFTVRGLALPTDHLEQLAIGRRQRRIEASPASLRPGVQAFAGIMMSNQARSRQAGTRPRTDHTIETALATVRDLALFIVSHRDKADWALVDVHDVEAFLAQLPRARARRLNVLRQFFRMARSHRIVLVNPTTGLHANTTKGFTGQTLRVDQQRELFQRWTSEPSAHPHEALLGILALLHGASSQEVRLLRCQDTDRTDRTIRLGRRPSPVPLDPASWQVLQRCLSHRQTQRTDNPHVVVTRVTKAGTAPASQAYLAHLLDACAVPARTVRCSRLAELVNTLDPKLVAAAFGMSPEAVMAYLSDYVDEARLPRSTSNP